MDVFTFVIIIVVIGCGTGVITEYLKTKRKTAEAGDADESVYEELDRLRERIEVLEKIVTDEKYHLQRELDALERSA
jgi:16S rRNA A1518/A1519 N6-dimethyltransferase RsmA/KsgA/DIM1 with predicted DNA glycosylase/AP lyase activity